MFIPLGAFGFVGYMFYQYIGWTEGFAAYLPLIVPGLFASAGTVFFLRPLIGWQIDNEIYPYGDGCYCNNCKVAFRRYLRDIYGSIENLNGRWGMTRWSLEYGSFEDVQPPYPNQWRHPSLRKAWWDFQCGQIKSYVEEQAEILHGYGCKNVGTDMMQNNYLSYYDLNEKLDVVQFNHYNKAEDLPFTAYFYDFLRCVKDKPFWVTETQVGWNGSEYADSGYRPAGNCYANTFLPLAKGAEMNLYWLFRTHPNGHELAHGAKKRWIIRQNVTKFLNIAK